MKMLNRYARLHNTAIDKKNYAKEKCIRNSQNTYFYQSSNPLHNTKIYILTSHQTHCTIHQDLYSYQSSDPLHNTPRFIFLPVISPSAQYTKIYILTSHQTYCIINQNIYSYQSSDPLHNTPRFIFLPVIRPIA